MQAAAARVEAPLHRGLTYVCVEGPRLGTQAQSHLFRQMGAQLVGMTNVPEVALAREAQMAYATVGRDFLIDLPRRCGSHFRTVVFQGKLTAVCGC